jgi:hypothetical protein
MKDGSVLPSIVLLVDVDIATIIGSVIGLMMVVGTYSSVRGIASHNVNIIFYYSKLDIERSVQRIKLLCMSAPICKIYYFGWLGINKFGFNSYYQILVV